MNWKKEIFYSFRWFLNEIKNFKGKIKESQYLNLIMDLMNDDSVLIDKKNDWHAEGLRLRGLIKFIK